MRHGEAHGRDTEKKKRQIQNMADAICELFDEEDFDLWNLAVPKDIAHQLIEQLPIQVQRKLTYYLSGDYTRHPAHEIKQLFTS